MADTHQSIIEQARIRAFDYLKSQMKAYGHFPLLDYYPTYEPRKNKGWHYNYESPFVHTSVLDALLNAGYSKSDPLIRKAADYLYKLREPGDLWRFWKINQAEHPIFTDVDETSICSFTLRKLGYSLQNQPIIYSRIREDGAVPTWIKADRKLMLIHPVAWAWLKYYDRHAMPTIHQWGWVTFDDAEPAVSANVLAYLGHNERTEKVFQYTVKGWYEVLERDYQYYDKKIVLAFHIARAYKEGIQAFSQLKDPIIEYLVSHHHTFSFPEKLLAYLSVYYFDFQHPYLKDLKSEILYTIEHYGEVIFEHYPYTTEKGRVYFGGGGCLTTAWFLEVSKDW